MASRNPVFRRRWNGITSGANFEPFQISIPDGGYFGGRIDVAAFAQDTQGTKAAQCRAGSMRLSAVRSNVTLVMDPNAATAVETPRIAVNAGTLTATVALVATGGNDGVIVRLVITSAGLTTTDDVGLRVTLYNDTDNEIEVLL